jgi:hypothetical protein
MTLYNPKNIAINWYQYDVSFSLELLETFAKGVEQQAADSILKYRSSVPTEAGQRGLDPQTWDLTIIFEEYFPTLQRRSAFLTIWGFLEHELDKLCLLYQSEKGFKLSFSDLSAKGVDRSTAYLEKVVGLAGLKISKEWEDIRTIQRIRNVVAHADGKLQHPNGQTRDEIIRDMMKVGFLKGESDLILEEGFLLKVIDIGNNYFRRIAAAIDTKENIQRLGGNVYSRTIP